MTNVYTPDCIGVQLATAIGQSERDVLGALCSGNAFRAAEANGIQHTVLNGNAKILGDSREDKLRHLNGLSAVSIIFIKEFFFL